MATSEAKEIKKQETLVRFSIISYKTRLSVSNFAFSIIGIFDFPTRYVLKSRIVIQKPELYNKIALLSGPLTY